MRIGIIGTGAIGGLFLAYLSERYKEIACTGRLYQIAAFVKDGLIVDGVRGMKHIRNIRITTHLKEPVDIAILAVKTQDFDEVISENKAQLKNSILVTTQNGVKADYILAKEFKKKNIVTSIVMFGSTFNPPNKIVHNFEGELVLGNIFGVADQKIMKQVQDLCKGIFDCSVSSNILGAKYLKIFLNLNNCISACFGKSMQEVYADPAICSVAISLIREAYQIIQDSRIDLESLPSFNKEKILGFVNMPYADAAGLFSKIMTSLSKEPLYGSILQSIQRRRATEIDYINGQIVELARQHKLEAVLNEKLTEMVHRVEATGRFFSKEEFMKETQILAQKYA